MKIIITFITFLFSIHFFAQNTIEIKNSKPTKTSEWIFVCENYAYNGYLTVQIIKTNKGGFLKLSTKTSNRNLTIGDRVFILLKDNSFVYCIDKNNKEYKDNIATAFYNLTDLELKKLASQNITDIRFKIIGNRNNFDSQTGFFTASNKPTVYDAYSKEIFSIDTNTEIRKIL